MNKLLLSFAIISSVASFNTNATGSQQTVAGNAISQCRGALPVYEGGLRSRPLAIVNEGNAIAFVNCGFIVPKDSYGVDAFSAVLNNTTASPVALSCTGVAGIENGPRNSYYVRSVSIPAFSSTGVSWTANDHNNGKRWNNSRNGQTANQNVGFQCVLAPGTSLGQLSVTYRYGG